MTTTQTSDTAQCVAFKVQPFASHMSTIEVESRCKYGNQSLPPAELNWPSFHGSAAEASKFFIALKMALDIAAELDSGEYAERKQDKINFARKHNAPIAEHCSDVVAEREARRKGQS